MDISPPDLQGTEEDPYSAQSAEPCSYRDCEQPERVYILILASSTTDLLQPINKHFLERHNFFYTSYKAFTSCGRCSLDF